MSLNSSYKMEALIRALKNRDFNTFRHLLDRSVDVNARYGYGSRTLLMVATQFDETHAVELLIERRADVNARDDLGNTALMNAAIFNSYASAKILLENDADVDAQNENGETALNLAMARLHLHFADLLLEYGADFFLRDKLGISPLMAALGRLGIIADQTVLKTYLKVGQARQEDLTTSVEVETKPFYLSQKAPVAETPARTPQFRRGSPSKRKSRKSRAEQLNFFNDLGFENN